ncbi:porin [Alcanivorax quisquiliarum]|uniref:Porin n=1 Tax=Alcanivorax quisquiliarum TaxID=2933565 RepID=A0ABT0E661_9GAMM|nr:porin [Alcanivorax quisquiliarum]MCK0537320.1 porin [Alcanivorax quisquiliarum]
MSITLRGTLPLVFAAATFPGFAQAQAPQFYGALHVSIDQIDSDIDGNSSQLNTSSNASLLGVRSTHRIGDHLSLLWQVESTIDLVNAGSIDVDRDSFVGLTGDWGLFRVGQFDTPMKVLRNRIDLFGNQAGDARNIVGVDGLDRRFKNGIHYRTPVFYGVTANLHYSTNTGDNATQSSDTQALSSSLEYRNGNFWAALAYDDDSTNDFKSYRLAGLYNLGDFRITALYQETDKPGSAASADTTAYGIGLRYKLNDKVALKTQYYRYELDDTDDSNAELAAVGVDYQYAPALLFYANYAFLENDNTYRTAYNVARTASTTTNATIADGDEKPAALSVGAIYRF